MTLSDDCNTPAELTVLIIVALTVLLYSVAAETLEIGTTKKANSVSRDRARAIPLLMAFFIFYLRYRGIRRSFVVAPV